MQFLFTTSLELQHLASRGVPHQHLFLEQRNWKQVMIRPSQMRSPNQSDTTNRAFCRNFTNLGVAPAAFKNHCLLLTMTENQYLLKNTRHTIQDSLMSISVEIPSPPVRQQACYLKLAVENAKVVIL